MCVLAEIPGSRIQAKTRELLGIQAEVKVGVGMASSTTKITNITYNARMLGRRAENDLVQNEGQARAGRPRHCGASDRGARPKYHHRVLVWRCRGRTWKHQEYDSHGARLRARGRLTPFSALLSECSLIEQAPRARD